jgi:hypothetical protein
MSQITTPKTSPQTSPTQQDANAMQYTTQCCDDFLMNSMKQKKHACPHCFYCSRCAKHGLQGCPPLACSLNEQLDRAAWFVPWNPLSSKQPNIT